MPEIKTVQLNVGEPSGGQREVEATFELSVRRGNRDIKMPITVGLRIGANDLDGVMRAALNELDAVLKLAAQ